MPLDSDRTFNTFTLLFQNFSYVPSSILNTSSNQRFCKQGMIMDTVYINWVKGVLPFHQIKDFEHETYDLDKNGFYAILAGARAKTKGWVKLKLLYIGQAFDQTLRERILQEHPAYECVFNYQKQYSDLDILVKIGFIEKSTVERRTQQLYDAIECCLILCSQPMCNTTCKESYSGRDLNVINKGHYFSLKEKCSCFKTET